MSAERFILAALFAAAACKKEPPLPQIPKLVAPADAVLIAAAGDISSAKLRDQQHTADLVADGGYDAVLLLGDEQYPAGALKDFQRYFEPTWGRFGDRLKPAPGNHEYLTPNAEGYFDYFGARAGERGKGWYSFDLGAWHVVALNTSHACEYVPCNAGSEQLTWLRDDLSRHRNRCTLAFFHYPRFSSGFEHGDAPEIDDVWRTLQEFGVDVVLNGHEHIYERFAPKRGVREFVVGTGGMSFYPLALTADEGSEVRHTGAFGILAMALAPDGYTWRFIPVPPATFTDSGSDACH